MTGTTIQQNKITGKYILVFFIAVLLSWVFHELAHVAAGEALGYNMGMRLNSAFPTAGKFSEDIHYHLISAAGPLFTIIQAIVFFLLMYKKNKPGLYPFLFVCFYMRLLATGISFFNPNDEARISTAMGIGKFTLPVIVTVILFYMVYKISKQYRFTKKFNLANFLLTMLFTSIIILSDQFFKIRIL